MTAATISFDLDGTLVTNAAGPVFREAIGRSGDSGDEAWNAVRERHHELLLRHPYDAYDWASIIGGVVGADASEVERRLVEGLAGSTPVLVHDGTIGSLGGLRADGWRIVVLTNGRRVYQVPVLDAAGLTSSIDELVTSDDVGEAKPAAAMFDAARGTAKRHVHVGDRFDHDVIGAARTGAVTVLLRPDVPFTSWVADSDRAERATLREYLLTVIDEEGTTSPDALSREPWPDVVAASLSDAVRLIGNPRVQ